MEWFGGSSPPEDSAARGATPTSSTRRLEMQRSCRLTGDPWPVTTHPGPLAELIVVSGEELKWRTRPSRVSRPAREDLPVPPVTCARALTLAEPHEPPPESFAILPGPFASLRRTRQLRSGLGPFSCEIRGERVTGIEPALSAWEADALLGVICCSVGSKWRCYGLCISYASRDADHPRSVPSRTYPVPVVNYRRVFG